MTGTNRRAIVVTASFLAFSLWLNVAARAVEPPSRAPLGDLPFRIDAWQGRDERALDARVLAVLGADDYLNRIYVKDDGSALGLYIGYYRSQRTDDSIHSPMNCLPGAGWVPSHSDRVQFADARSPGQTVNVNRVIVQKGEQRQLALYWYQSRGSVVASEYASKMHLFVGALRTGRTDAALVRIMSPIADSTEPGANSDAVHFASALLPLLGRYIPD